MIKIAMYKKRMNLSQKQSLLVIWKTPKGNLIGEVFDNGIEKRGKWDMRATFSDRSATTYRVREYFGFTSSNSFEFWKRWA